MKPADAFLTRAGAGQRPDRIRLFRHGFLFTSDGAELSTCRHSASLLLALTEAPFELEIAGESRRVRAALVGPFVGKQLRAQGVPFACLDLAAPHPQFRSFSRIARPGWQPLPPGHFSSLEERLRAFHAGALSDAASAQLYHRAMILAATLLPAPGPLDARVQRVLAQLEAQPGLGIDALAQTACLSPDRLSHLFSQAMGLPLRKHLQSLKIRAAACLYGEAMNLTQIAAAAGFSDSAHFSKVWMQAYGSPPARYFCSGAVAVYPPLRGAGTGSGRFRSRNAANSHERMPTTSV